MNTPFLETHSLSRYFTMNSGAFGTSHTLKAVDGVNIHLQPGETLGLAGESGCGKSTLARLIMGLIAPSDGTIAFRGKSLVDMSKVERFAFRKDVQIIFQDP